LIFKEISEKQVEKPASRVEGRIMDGRMMEKLQAQKMKVERVEQKYPE
jgi:hypothetical protein